MMMALTTKNKVGFFDGYISQPASDNPLFNAQNRCNIMVISWLLNSISKEIAQSIMYINSTHEIWIDLCDCFYQSNVPCIFQLKKQLVALQQGALDINAYNT